LEIISNRN
jgi:hypothetical protein